jgi:hypothetical protein
MIGQEPEAEVEDSQLRARSGENAERRIETIFSWEGTPLVNYLIAYRQFAKP